MGFFQRLRDAKKNKNKAKDEMIVISDIPEDSEQILTMPDTLEDEGLITKPQVEEDKPILSTAESTLPFTTPMEDENYEEAEMLNKLEAEQESKEEPQPMLDTLSDAMAMEMELDSDELMQILDNLPKQPEMEESVVDAEEEQLTKEKQKQAMSQILSNQSAESNAFTLSDMQNVFSSEKKEEAQELKPTEKVSNIFGKTTSTTTTKPTPTEWVHSVFGQEERKRTNNDLPTRDSMRDMLSSQKKKVDNTIPTKNELFKTITDKDK